MPTHIVVYYATMTGNAEVLARRAEARARVLGWRPRLQNLSEVKPAELVEDGPALFIVPTWGDGKPPADAADFWYDLERASPDLRRLQFAVFGLGDRDDSAFNAFARSLDERLLQLGATRLLPRIEADLDFDDTYAEWETRVFSSLAAAPQAVVA